jgi:hypothetical protein
MFTVKYKTWFINGYVDNDQCVVCLPDGGVWGTYPTMLSAKRAITKAITWVRVKQA